jgi:hypothetical protein
LLVQRCSEWRSESLEAMLGAIDCDH